MYHTRNNEVVIRIVEVNDLVEQNKFYRVIINEGERLVKIIESEKIPKILKYKSITKS